jgi:hypothetical protein
MTMKIFNKTQYMSVLGQYISGVSPGDIRELYKDFIDKNELDDYLIDISQRYKDVINWGNVRRRK